MYIFLTLEFTLLYILYEYVLCKCYLQLNNIINLTNLSDLNPEAGLNSLIP